MTRGRFTGREGRGGKPPKVCLFHVSEHLIFSFALAVLICSIVTAVSISAKASFAVFRSAAGVSLILPRP